MLKLKTEMFTISIGLSLIYTKLNKIYFFKYSTDLNINC